MPISPTRGPTGGGTLVTITGTNLTGTTAVKFGTKSVAATVVSPTTVTATSPSGTGTVQVSLVTPAGTSNGVPFFYIPGPALSSAAPTAGGEAGGNTVTITGINLATATSVDFGATSATPTVVSDNTITAVSPAGTGIVALKAVTAGGSTGTVPFTYEAPPTITTVAPASGPQSGGTAVTITGTALGETTGVLFGALAANFLTISDTQVVALAPAAAAAGAVDVVVTTAGGTDTVVGGYTYVAGPGI